MRQQPIDDQQSTMPQATNTDVTPGLIHFTRLFSRFWKLNPMLLITSTIAFALFVPLAWWAHKHPQPPDEIRFTRMFQKKQPSLVRRIVQVLNTITGSASFLNMFTIPTAIVLWKRRLRLEAIFTIGVSWTNALARTLVKQLVNRPRPNAMLVHRAKKAHGKSFPSGHTSSTLAFWGWLFALGMLLRKGSSMRQNALLSFPALCIILVGPARIYLGEHWATDVLGGYLFGSGWLSLSLRLYRALRNKGSFAGS